MIKDFINSGSLDESLNSFSPHALKLYSAGEKEQLKCYLYEQKESYQQGLVDGDILVSLGICASSFAVSTYLFFLTKSPITAVPYFVCSLLFGYMYFKHIIKRDDSIEDCFIKNIDRVLNSIDE